MRYIAMTVSTFLAVVNACLLRKYGEIGKKGMNAYLFNAGVNIVWIIILSGILIASDSAWNPTAVLYGVVYGVILFAFLFFKTQSMVNGPVSLSTLIGSCAFVIATVFGVIYCEESVASPQVVGMVLLFISLMLCVNPQKSKEKLTKKWMLYCLGFFIAGGFTGILYKMFGKSSACLEHEVMLLAAAIVAELLFLTFGFFQTKKYGGTIRPDKRISLFVLLCGIASCLYIRLNLSLSNMIPSVIFFPVSNGGMVILSTIAGKMLFHEKLTGRQLLGIMVGCIAVAVVGCGDYMLRLFY